MIALQENSYPGRGLVVGVDPSGQFLVQIYWIMGRSDNSRNRVFSTENGRLFTEAADPAKMKDPSLVIYNAMLEKTLFSRPLGFFVVSNGDQTDTVFEKLSILCYPSHTYLPELLESRAYEPDAPNFTSRITAVTHLRIEHWRTEIAVLRKSVWGESCDRLHYVYSEIAKGFGFCVTTYVGDGDPLPAFTGEPLLVPIPGGINDTLKAYLEMLNEANRVSLAVKYISLIDGKSELVAKNKYAKVSQ